MSKLGRNDPCRCGSGQKYKKCCSAQDEAKRAAELAAQATQRAAAAAEALADAPAKAASAVAKQSPTSGGLKPKLPAAAPPQSFRRRAV